MPPVRNAIFLSEINFSKDANPIGLPAADTKLNAIIGPLTSDEEE